MKVISTIVENAAFNPLSYWLEVFGVPVTRAGSLYGELARFVLRILGYKGKPKEQPPMGGPQAMMGPPRLPGLPGAPGAQPGAPDWDNMWGS